MLGSWVRAPCGSPSKRGIVIMIIPLFAFRSSYHRVFILPLFRSDHHTIAFSFFLFFVLIIIPLRFHSSSFSFQSSEDFILIVPPFAFNSSYYYISILSFFRSAYLTIHCKSDMLLLLERMIEPQIKGQMME